MKSYVDLDLMKNKTGVSDAGVLVRDMLEYASSTKKYDFIVPITDYVSMIRSAMQISSPLFTAGRTEDNMPYFSIAGITFSMITEEEADKYRILK